KIVAVTGSSGKSTLINILYEITKQNYNVLKLDISNRDHIEVDRRVLNEMSPDIDLILLEISSFKPGDISRITSIYRPDIGILTNVGHSHLDTHGGHHKLLKSKLEIAENLKEGGALVINGDDEQALKLAHHDTHNEVVYFASKNYDR